MEKKYRVEYNIYGIVSVQLDGEFNTSSGNQLIADTLPNIKIMLTALQVDCNNLDELVQTL